MNLLRHKNYGLTSGIVVKNTSTTGAAYSGVFLESQDAKYSQFFSTNSTYTGYRSIQASTFGHLSNVTNGMAIQLDGSNASLRIGMGLSEIARFTLSGALALGTSSPDASAILQANSTTRGWLPPRWTAVQRTAIPSPATALFGYQTDGTEGLYIKAAAGFKRLLWEGDAVNTWLKPSLEAGSVNITQGRVNKLRFNQDSGYFHLKNGVIFLQHPTEKDPASALPQVIITSDTLARWNKSGAVVSIGSQLGSNNATGYGYTMVGSLTRGVVNGSICYFSSAYGYDVGIDSTIKVNAIGHKISANRVTDSDAYGGYITFAKDVNNSGAYGSWITVNRNQSFVYGRGISTRHTNEFLYGSSFSPKHTFSGSKVMFGLDSTFSFNITTKLLQLSAYGTSATTAATLGKTESGYLTSFATDGTVTSFKLARDTFIEDVTLFSVGTLLNSCQELTIVSSMTSTAPTNQEIRFPDAADYLRGKKIIVYSKKKDAGAYVPYISVVGGVSRLFYTTNPGIGGIDPSNQAYLYIDDGTWSDHGTTFEFTCLKIDNTPSYRWVLKQR